jgi:thymidylate kinase
MITVKERPALLRAPTLLDRLGEALDLGGVTCCQWKGHFKRAHWETGAGDVDILVDPVMSEQLDGVLDRLGFKLALPAPEGLIPGTASWYGYDATQRALIHVHVHVRLTLGGYWTTMYRLPIERALLEATAPRLPFAVPEPELEFLTFVLRSVQRYRVLDLFAAGQPAWLRAAQPEFAYLLNQVDRRRLLARLGELLPSIDPAFFDACARSLRPGVSNWLRLWLRWNLHWRLRPHAHQPPGMLFIKRVLRRLRLLPRPPGMRLARGGRLFALLGADGAGKSTCTAELTRWLGAQFDVRKAHLGRPPRSLTTLVVGGLLKLRRRMLRRGGAEGTPGVLELLRLVCTARDRYLLFTKMRTFAEAGGIGLCERYPVPQNRLLVGPEIARLLGHGRDTPLARRLMRIEQWYYRRITPPDVIMVLRVEPEVAVRRKTDEPADYVRARARIIWDTDWQGTGAHLVDAGRTLSEVIADLKAVVWSEL